MDAVQLFAQSPRTWRFPDHDPADLEAFRARREELGIGAVSIHALYLINLASPKDDFYEKSVATLRSTVDTACAIGADAVVFHVGSHLGSGFEAGLERVVPALRRGARALQRDDLALHGERRGHRRHGRPLARGAGRDLRRARPPPAARRLPRLVPPVRLRLRHHRAGRARRPARPSSTARSGSTACAACT